VQRFVVSAKRRDGSSLTRLDLHYSEAMGMVTALRALDSWPLSITMEEMQAGIEQRVRFVGANGIGRCFEMGAAGRRRHAHFATGFLNQTWRSPAAHERSRWWSRDAFHDRLANLDALDRLFAQTSDVARLPQQRLTPLTPAEGRMVKCDPARERRGRRRCSRRNSPPVSAGARG
jgi:hypothetical protein